MGKAVIFGGTTEGRKLCNVCAEHAVPVLYCVATPDGARPVEMLPHVQVHIGRLGTDEMTALLAEHMPTRVFDATHPYAYVASQHIAAACKNANVPLLRVTREGLEEPNCLYFDGIDDLIAWLAQEPGNVFVTTGSSHAKAFARLPDYQHRVWLRVLPSIESLQTCLDLGYRPDRIICMQGPFSEEMNHAMFKDANARILVTKNAGHAGGFSEKIRAAQRLGMRTAVLAKPSDPGGVSLEEACKRIVELAI